MDWIANRAANFRKLVTERDRLAVVAAAAHATPSDRAALVRANGHLRAARSRMDAMGDPIPNSTPQPIPAAEAAVKVTASVAPVAPVVRSGAVKPIVQEDVHTAAQRLADEIVASARLAGA